MDLQTVKTNKSNYFFPDNWEFADVNTQLYTHGIHRYSGKFIPQIAREAILTLTKENDRILDIFCGSGTTLLEAALEKRVAYGIDLNPLAVLISKVKTTRLTNSDIKAIENFGHSCLTEDQCLSNTVEADRRMKDEWFLKWFGEENLLILVDIKIRIDTLSSENQKNVCLIAFSDILRKSSKAHSGYPNVMFDKNKVVKTNIRKAYHKRLIEVLGLVNSLNSVDWLSKFTPKVEYGNSEQLPFKSNFFDSIITHPPYVGSVPYAEYGQLSLMWLSEDPKILDTKLTGGGRQKKDVLDRFKNSFQRILDESFRVLKPNGSMFLMVGNPTIKGQIFELDEFAILAAEISGFKLFHRAYRNGVNRRANKMGKESLLFFRK